MQPQLRYRAARAQGTVASFLLLTAAATSLLLSGLAGERQTLLPLATLWCQGFLRSLKMCASHWLGLPRVRNSDRDVSFFPSSRVIHSKLALCVVSAEFPGQAHS